MWGNKRPLAKAIPFPGALPKGKCLQSFSSSVGCLKGAIRILNRQSLVIFHAVNVTGWQALQHNHLLTKEGP